MSKLFLTNINLNGNQLLNGVIHKAATAPTSPAPVSGQIYYNTTDNVFYVYTGSAWTKIPVSGGIVNADISSSAAIDKTKISGTAVTLADSGTITATMIADGTIMDAEINASAGIQLSKLATNPLARANHTGTQLAATISDFDTQVRTNRLDQLASPTASVSLNSQKITNLLDPTNAQDAATKAYVDATRQGLDVKDSVKAATTANITLSAPQTIDGVSLVAGDRVLVKDQSTASANGIYVVAASAWTRATDADTAAKLSSGSFVFVEQGTVNADSGWVMTQDAAITLGTTSITWAQFSGAGQVTAGAGLTKTGNTLDVGTASSFRIVVNADNIDLAPVTAGNTTPAMGTSAVTGVTVDPYGRVTGVATSTTKYAGQNASLTVTSGSATWTVTHNLGTTDVIVQMREVATNALVEADVVITSTNVVTITIASTGSTIATDTYRVVVLA